MKTHQEQRDRDPRSLWQGSLDELLERIGSTRPTPGGGSSAIVTASIGAALLQKAFAVSLKKAAGSGPTDELERLIAALSGKTSALQQWADRDAEAFEDYLRAVRLPHNDPARLELRQKAMEKAMADATAMPLGVIGEIQPIVESGFHHLSLVHPVIVSDALVGLRLLLASSKCLLMTAEDNLASLSGSTSFASLETQWRDRVRWVAASELELERRLRERAQG